MCTLQKPSLIRYIPSVSLWPCVIIRSSGITKWMMQFLHSEFTSLVTREVADSKASISTTDESSSSLRFVNSAYYFWLSSNCRMYTTAIKYDDLQVASKSSRRILSLRPIERPSLNPWISCYWVLRMNVLFWNSLIFLINGLWHLRRSITWFALSKYAKNAFCFSLMWSL